MLGIFSKTTDSSFIEAMGHAGYDFVIIDQEHGPVQRDKLYDHVRAAKLGQLKSIVRVSENNHNLIGSALDTGAFGVQVPNISTVLDAKNAIKAARFFPFGNRGVCRFVAAASYGEKAKSDYFSDENKKLLILQIEGTEAISNLNEILELDGFDILFVGPYDLSQSLGVPGQITHTKVREEILKIRARAKENKVKLGSFADNVETYNFLIENDFEYIAYSVDVSLFIEGLKYIKTKLCK
ncbi:HpcH/HpaI aldolase family protein [Flavobacterium lacus]|uniref:4-hydroxy-2-oxoheptanedioate aldolase n=1 Tax=Flavobacterium lacus TaxID=1353778 RepID=A0A328WQ60_9FLAO|nr:aldolase/citrate lyase family protein [Flavobacterium lacus]RAR47246.1 4-hydroxy-2-oxoheptanedioate aldolase [Flavobacterium lacus]